MLNKCNSYHNRGIMINNIPFLRKEVSTLLLLSAAAIAVLLLASPLVPLSNLLLQPAQATYTSVQTPNPVALGDNCNVANAELTFDAQGNPSSLTSGTFQVTNSSSGQILWSGDLYQGSIGSDHSNGGLEVDIVYSVDGNNLVCNAGSQLWVTTYCPGGPSTEIDLETDGAAMGSVTGTIQCDGARDTTAQQSSPSPSSPMTGTTQDSDRDGIPDSSDRCIHNPHHRCYKEGGDISTTSTQQQPPSNRTGNQTR